MVARTRSVGEAVKKISAFFTGKKRETMSMAYILANLAVSRAQLRRGISTARGCGDSAWVRENLPSLESLDRRIASLMRVLRPEVVSEAREITNASI